MCGSYNCGAMHTIQLITSGVCTSYFCTSSFLSIPASCCWTRITVNLLLLMQLERKDTSPPHTQGLYCCSFLTRMSSSTFSIVFLSLVLTESMAAFPSFQGSCIDPVVLSSHDTSDLYCFNSFSCFFSFTFQCMTYPTLWPNVPLLRYCMLKN